MTHWSDFSTDALPGHVPAASRSTGRAWISLALRRVAVGLILGVLLLAGSPFREAGACAANFNRAWNFCGDDRSGMEFFDPTSPSGFEIVAVATAKRKKRFLLTGEGPVAVSEAEYWRSRQGFTETETELEVTAVMKGEIGDVAYVRTTNAGMCGPNGPVFDIGRRYVLFFAAVSRAAQTGPAAAPASADSAERQPGIAFAACYEPEAPWYQTLLERLKNGKPGTVRTR